MTVNLTIQDTTVVVSINFAIALIDYVAGIDSAEYRCDVENLRHGQQVFLDVDGQTFLLEATSTNWQ